jgi:hypothetical protein
MACPHHDRCELSHHIGMTAALRVWQSFYCNGSHARCERFKLVEAGRAVPTGLLPNGRLGEAAETSGRHAEGGVRAA